MADSTEKSNIPNILDALKEEFATSINNIYVNSLKTTYGFRDITVLEQKTFAKLLIDHENEPDVVYDTQCALIQKLALDKDFDVYKITEFDRLKIFFLIYQSNFFSHNFTATCQYCNSKFDYSIDFDKIIKSIDEFNVDDVKVEQTIKNRKYEFIINFPSVRRMAEYKKYQAFLNRKNKKQTTSAASMLDMIDLLIKYLKITNLDTGNEIEIKSEEIKYSEYVKYLETIPQNIIYSENSSLIKVAKEKLDLIKQALPKVKCTECGETIEIIGDIDGFFL